MAGHELRRGEYGLAGDLQSKDQWDRGAGRTGDQRPDQRGDDAGDNAKLVHRCGRVLAILVRWDNEWAGTPAIQAEPYPGGNIDDLSDEPNQHHRPSHFRTTNGGRFDGPAPGWRNESV